MIKIHDICNQKIPLNLRGLLPQSSCPLGNASILPSLDEQSYLCSFRQFKNVARWRNQNQYKIAPNVFTPTNKNTIWFGKIDNNFFPVLRYDNKIGFSSVKVNNHLFNNNFQYEDLRLFYWKNSIYASGSRLETEYRNGKVLYRAYQVIGNIIDCSWTININIKYDSKCDELLSRQLLQKNWMAIPDKPNKLIYLVGQTNNNIIDISTNHIESFAHNNIVLPYDIRGNTPLLRVDDNRYITLVHVKDNSSYYISYFLVVNNDLKIEHISQKFRFDSSCFIEFSTSMFYQNNTNQQIIGITVCENDCFQYVYLFDKNKIMDFIFDNHEVHQKESKEIQCVVSLTSYPHRFQNPDFLKCLESLVNQSTDVKYKIVLNIYQGDMDKLPRCVMEYAEQNNIEILSCEEDIRQHKKYFYYMQKNRTVPIIIVDDDCEYANCLVEDLYKTHLANPNVVICGKAQQIMRDQRRQIMPYAKWRTKTTPNYKSKDMFAVGSGGVLYPPCVCNAVADNITIDIIRKVKSDDFLLHMISSSLGLERMSVDTRRSGNICFGFLIDEEFPCATDEHALYIIMKHDYKSEYIQYIDKFQSIDDLVECFGSHLTSKNIIVE